MSAMHPPAGTKLLRQRAILEVVAESPVGSQDELAELLRERGFEVTQATVSRDVAELGLAKVARDDGHVYVAPERVARPTAAQDQRLARLLAELPVTIGRSGLSLVLTASPGTAGAIAQAIDQSSLDDQVGTLAGDNTLLVLFGDDQHLEHWLERFQVLQQPGVPVADRSGARESRGSVGRRPAARSTRPTRAAQRTQRRNRTAERVSSRTTTLPDTIQLATDSATEIAP